jgi:hypothetical protein
MEFKGNAVAINIRETLQANATKYIRSDGSNDNSGDADSSDGAWADFDGLTTWLARLDGNGFSVDVYIGDGTYNASLSVPFTCLNVSSVNVHGNTGTPGSVIISTTGSCVDVQKPNQFSLDGMSLTSSGGSLIVASFGAYIIIGAGMEFGDAEASSVQIYSYFGGNIRIEADYTVNGDAYYHIQVNRASFAGYYSTPITITIDAGGGTLAFNTWARVRDLSMLQAASLTHAGDKASVTGKEYNVSAMSELNTGGGGSGYFPGDSAGLTSLGGRYD